MTYTIVLRKVYRHISIKFAKDKDKMRLGEKVVSHQIVTTSNEKQCRSNKKKNKVATKKMVNI